MYAVSELSALDRIEVVEKILDCVDSPICEVTILRNEIALIMKPEFSFLKIAKSGLAMNVNNNSSRLSQISRFLWLCQIYLVVSSLDIDFSANLFHSLLDSG